MTIKIQPPTGAKRPATSGELAQIVTDLGLDDLEGRLAALESGTTTIRVVNDNRTGTEDTPATGNVLSNDSTTSGTLSVTTFTVAGVAGVFLPGQTATISGIGTIVILSSGAYTFTPVTNWNGAVPAITYQVTNGTSMSSGILLISIGAVANAPIAVDDAPATGTINTPLTFSPLANDSSPDGGTLTVTKVNGVTVTVGGTPATLLNGTVALLSGNQLRVTPNTGYSGTFNFTYTIQDSSNGLTATATAIVSFADPGAPGVTYYVDSNAANDSGNGSISNPKKYIQSGAALMSPFGGDTLIIKSGTYSNALDRINNLKSGTASRWNIVKAEVDGGVTITAGFAMPLDANDQPIDHYIQFEGLNFDDQFSKGITGRYVKVMRCFFRGGPLTDNTNNMGCGTNDYIPGAEYILFEDCLFYGVGGRYSVLSYDSDKVIFRRCVVRHAPGWSDIKGDPQGGISVYNNINTQVQNCIVLDSPAMTNLEAGIFHPSNNRTSSNLAVRGCVVINFAAAGVSWDDSAPATNLLCEDTAAIGCGAPFVANGGPKAVSLNRCTAVNGTGSSIRGYGSAVIQLSNSIVWTMANGANIGGVTLNGTNNYFNPGAAESVAVTEGNLNPATNGLLYPVRLENGSALKTAGKGATIIKRIGVSGTLWGETGWDQVTTENLWPFPQEARIKAALQADSAYGFATIGRKRLNGVDPETLTTYVWEALGNQIPAEVYAPSAPSNTTAPTITGQFVRGGTLTVNTGVWTNSPDSYGYQWTKAGADISGATDPTYSPVVGDVGSVVACKVRATNGTGTSAYVTATGQTVAAATAPGTVTPTVTGDLFVGGVLTCNPGTITGAPSPTLVYEWKRGATVVGTNSPTYTAEATGSHTCKVTATNVAGSSNGTSSAVTVGGLTTVTDTFVEASPPVLLSAHNATGANGGWAWSKPAGFSGTNLQVITGGQVIATGGSAANFQPWLCSTVPTSADQDISATITFGSTGRTSLLIGGRISADGTVGYWAWQSGGTWVIYKRYGGVWGSALASGSETSGGAFGMRLVLRNGSQKLYKGATLICESFDTDITAAGRVGIASFYSEPVDTNSLSNFSANWPI
jgi:hypothetical protein